MYIRTSFLHAEVGLLRGLLADLGAEDHQLRIGMYWEGIGGNREGMHSNMQCVW